ncbi:SnoaL-like domain [Candidatus Nitrososphaera evergladensis SR1]|uniref:SnoaL-like domain n=1 Tax=Candidatus Nitrososphaera evergladensis SR1 TaxID=1459636 RepID=A0A075MT04_9ARCH|nr:SnoaL-like domain [Candidatus Nitrososphaera evergladensis SR1]
MSVTDSTKIRDLIYKYFQIAKSKEIEHIPAFFAERFTKFGDSPPYDLRDADRALMLEQLQFASISDYDFKINDLKIEIVAGEVAIATFALESTGIIVDDYSFRGTAINNKSRVTIMFQKDKKKEEWKMLHQHFSRMPS